MINFHCNQSDFNSLHFTIISFFNDYQRCKMVHLPYFMAFSLCLILYNINYYNIMKTKLIIAIALFMAICTVNAQTLGDFKPKENRGALGPRKFPSKDVYIANFSVNYQVFNYRKVSSKGGGGLMGGVIGKTQAELAVGLDIPATTIQQITNDAYAKFVNDLKAKGFNVLPGDAVKNIDYYKAYERHQGLFLMMMKIFSKPFKPVQMVIYSKKHPRKNCTQPSLKPWKVAQR